MKTVHLIFYFLIIRMTDGGLEQGEHVYKHGVKIHKLLIFRESWQSFSTAPQTHQLFIKERLKYLLKKTLIKLVNHENGSIQVRVPKSELLDLVSVKQTKRKNLTFYPQLSKMLVESSDKLEEVTKIKTVETVTKLIEPRNQEFSKTNDNKGMVVLETIKEPVRQPGKDGTVRALSLRSVPNAESVEMTSKLSRSVVSSQRKKYVPLSMLLDNKINFVS